MSSILNKFKAHANSSDDTSRPPPIKTTRRDEQYLDPNRLFATAKFDFSAVISTCSLNVEENFTLRLTKLPSERVSVTLKFYTVSREADPYHLDVDLVFKNDVQATILDDTKTRYVYEVIFQGGLHTKRISNPSTVTMFTYQQERRDSNKMQISICKSDCDYTYHFMSSIEFGIRRLSKVEIDELTDPRYSNIHLLHKMRRGLYSDVIVISQDGMKLPAHKEILYNLIPAFKEVPVLESCSHDGTDVMRLMHLDGETVNELLHYVYFRELRKSLTFPQIVNVYAAAQKYCIDELTKEAREFLLFNMNAETLDPLYQLANEFADVEMNKYVQAYAHNVVKRR